MVKCFKCKYEYDFIYIHTRMHAHTHVTVGINRTETQETSTIGCLRRADLGVKDGRMREYFQCILFCASLILQPYNYNTFSKNKI